MATCSSTESVRDVRVVVEEAEAARPPVAGRAEKTAVVRAQRAEEERAELTRRREPVLAVEPGARLRERGEREAVPRGESLVVAERLRAGVALRENTAPELGIDLATHDQAPVLERLEHVLRQAYRGGFLGRPRVRQPLDAFGVRIVRRRERAARERELAQHVPERLLHDLAVALAPGDDPGVQVRRGEDGVVVEHLLEVRDEPAVVHGVAVKATADDVVEAAGSHAVERGRDHRERLLVAAPEEELERRRRGELGGTPEAAEGRLERRGDPSRGVGEERRRERLARRPRSRGRAQRVVDPRGLPLDVVAPLAPGVGDRAQELGEARDPVPRLGREVGARVERLRVRRHEDRRRPAAGTGHPDCRLHRHGVDVGALLAIDLHVHEELVHERSRRLRLERLVCHHVAPVARAVADGDEERLVLGPSALERLVAPLEPVDRVLGVLEEIGRGRAREAVHRMSVRQPLAIRRPCSNGSSTSCGRPTAAASSGVQV